MKPFVDLTGRIFGRLTVTGYAGKSDNKMFMFHCLCECGTTKIVRGSHLRLGKVKSCGCFRRETSAIKIKLVATTHGHCTEGISPTYQSWAAMHERCTRKKHPAYHHYGGKGVSVCERWQNFENFLADMGERPFGKTLDRKNGSGNYEPGNCRWATSAEQASNRCNNRLLSFNGETMILSDWARKTGFGVTTIRERLHRGWSVERALTQVPLCQTAG